MPWAMRAALLRARHASMPRAPWIHAHGRSCASARLLALFAMSRALQDVFDPHITLLAPDLVDTSLESLSANRSIASGSMLLFSFLGTKGAGGLHVAVSVQIHIVSAYCAH